MSSMNGVACIPVTATVELLASGVMSQLSARKCITSFVWPIVKIATLTQPSELLVF